MALQGTLDTFALPDVLRLLASTQKTGRLRVEGDRGAGSVWLAEGQVVGTEATGVRGDSEVDVVFQLLCYRSGAFNFEADVAPSLPSNPIDVEPLLREAERLLIEWRDIEKVVPSVEAWVTLVPTLPRTEMYIDSQRWRTVCAIGSGTTVSALGRALDSGDVMACLVVKDLVDMGLVEVGTAPLSPLPMATAPPPPPPPLATCAPLESAIAAAPPAPPPTPVPMMAAAPTEVTVTPPAPAQPVDEQPPPAPAAPAPAPPTMDMEDDPDEVARQLATLSPKAARAVAVASDPTYQAEADDDDLLVEVDAADGEDESINRNLLIKFLSSVKN